MTNQEIEQRIHKIYLDGYKDGLMDASKKEEKYNWNEMKEDFDLFGAEIEILQIFTNRISNEKTYVYNVGVMTDEYEFYDNDDDYICDFDDVDYWRLHKSFNKE